ncbi:hypothetical protein F5Y05DRAFT_419015 [Hypoxylon sp. FL0543]|nr:hypothetical protein F5Y05DRAFT_419015 [Hypoxylon sp. FL0543]
MKAFISLLVGAFTAGVVAKGGRATNKSDAFLPDGYTSIPFSMKGAIEPGGEVMQFNGTVTDIFEQIQDIKPNFKWDDFQPVAPLTRRRRPSKRTKSHIICDVPNVQPSIRLRFLFGQDYLWKIQQPCEVAGGPRKCALLWCDYDSTIYLCNDNTEPISRNCRDIASYVRDLLGDLDCATTPSDSDNADSWLDAPLKGQEFDTDNFNVIVGGGGC